VVRSLPYAYTGLAVGQRIGMRRMLVLGVDISISPGKAFQPA
jgi:hypothetical protein